jgi:hypothetical protein
VTEEAFYATAAQVIPVILVAIFVGQRWSGDDSDASHDVARASLDWLGLLGLLSLAELTALVALIDGPAGPSKVVILVAISYGLLSLLFEPLLTLTQQAAPRLGRVIVPILLVVVVVLGVTVGVAALAWMALAIFLGLVVIHATIRFSAIPRELREEAGVSPTVSRTEGDPVQPSATERN